MPVQKPRILKVNLEYFLIMRGPCCGVLCDLYPRPEMGQTDHIQSSCGGSAGPYRKTSREACYTSARAPCGRSAPLSPGSSENTLIRRHPSSISSPLNASPTLFEVAQRNITQCCYHHRNLESDIPSRTCDRTLIPNLVH